jgi:maleate isomerase
MEPDLYQHLPPGVTLHTARMLLQGGVTIEAEERMLDEYLPKSAQEISTMRPDVVVFGCTSAGALRGPAYEQGLAQQLSQTTGAPAITIMGAVVEELNRLAARRVAVLSPYSQEVNETIQRSLEASGFDVVYLAGMDLPSAFGIADVSPEQVVDYAGEHLQGVEADCLFVSCANLRSLEAIEDLRAVAGMSVITSNQAVLESVKRVLEIQHHDMAIAAAPEG